MSGKPPSRIVFVGNIPYGLSEEQITDIFTSAGKVLNFRLVYDRETGRPKGYGFAEFPDIDSASSAVRNLNNYEVIGRQLRVDFSNENAAKGGDDGPGNNASNDSYSQPANGMASSGAQSGALPPLPPGKELPPGVTCSDAISRTLNTLPPAQLLDILSQFKTMATTEPQRATELLNQAPQLAYAIFQALLLMGVVSPEAINSVLDPNAAPQPPVGYPPQQDPRFAAVATPAMMGTPPVAAPAPYAPPQSAMPAYGAPAPAMASAAAGQDPEALIQQVLSLPQETIDQLPEAEKAQILALRANFMAQRR